MYTNPLLCADLQRKEKEMKHLHIKDIVIVQKSTYSAAPHVAWPNSIPVPHCSLGMHLCSHIIVSFVSAYQRSALRANGLFLQATVG